MAVGGGVGIDRALEVEVTDDRARTQIEDVGHGLLEPLDVHLLGTERLDEEADRGGLADGVGDLDLDALGQAGGDDVLGHPPHGVGGRAVHLGGVLTGEGTATVTGHAAIGVHDDLASGQAGVAHGAAEDEASGGIDEEPVVTPVDPGGGLAEHRLDDVLGQIVAERGLQVDAVRVLGRDDDGVEPDRAVAVVLDGDLGLAVRAQVVQGAGLADLGQAPGQPVRQRDRQGHEFRGIRAGVAEHQALVAGALAGDLILDGVGGRARLMGGVDALRDLGRLLADRDRDAARDAVEALVRGVVADLHDLLADELRDLHVPGGLDLAGDVYQSGGDHGLHRDPGVRVLLQHRVQDRVRDRVTDLVRMPLGHGFAGEQPTCLRHSGSLFHRGIACDR